MAKHDDFIYSPVESILADAVLALGPIAGGIDTYPINEYLMKTIFLQMTGFQEQKFKCIAWEVATEDFEFRREFLNNFSTEGFSTYDSKRKLYNKVMRIIKRDELTVEERKKIVKDSKLIICGILDNSNLQFWNMSSYSEFKQTISDKLGYTQFALKGKKGNTNLLENIAKEVYDSLYYYRNRLAHNTFSYQRNLPTFKSLENTDSLETNYFVWFYLLVVIDKIMIKIYEEFQYNNQDLLRT